jgi:ADP-heptose:LPS heptosyltransferase
MPAGTQAFAGDTRSADSDTILFITLSNIGDALMTTPVMTLLHRRHPRARMDIVADPRSSELFTHCPYRDRLLHRDKRRGLRGTIALVKTLRQRRYDLIVDLRTDGLAWLLRGHVRRTRRLRKELAGHAVERHLGIVSGPEGIAEIPPTRTWLGPAEHHAAREQLSPLPGSRWLGIGPGARWEPKRWPAGRFRELAQDLATRFDAVVLFGGTDDAVHGREIAIGLSLPCLDLCGRTRLLQAAALLQRMRLFVGNDSGLGHLAAAVDTPTVTVFGPGDPLRYHPWNRRGIWLSSATGRIADLPAAEVADAVTVLLEG